MIEENAFLISQILIGFAFVSDFFSFQFKSRKKVLAFIVLSCFFIATHLFLLKEYTGAVLISISMVRYFISIYTTNQRLMYFFLVLIFVGTYFTYTRWVDLLALLSNILFNFAAFEKTNKRFRLIMMSGTSCWICYNIFIFSPAGIALEVNFLISNLIGYYRFYIRKQKPKKDLS